MWLTWILQSKSLSLCFSRECFFENETDRHRLQRLLLPVTTLVDSWLSGNCLRFFVKDVDVTMKLPHYVLFLIVEIDLIKQSKN